MPSDMRHSHSVGLYPDTIWLPLVYPGDRPLSVPSSDTERLSGRERKRRRGFAFPRSPVHCASLNCPFINERNILRCEQRACVACDLGLCLLPIPCRLLNKPGLVTSYYEMHAHARMTCAPFDARAYSYWPRSPFPLSRRSIHRGEMPTPVPSALN